MPGLVQAEVRVRLRRVAAAGLTLALVFAPCLGCSGSGDVGSTENASIVLITLDTTRRDRIGCYGYERARTPRLDDLAANGVVFDHAVATCPVTLPSHGSILTGTYPTFHGARDNGIYRLPEELTTLAEHLDRSGYQTAAVIGAAVLEARYGLAQGFDHYDDAMGDASSEFHYAERRAPEVTAAALEIARGFSRDRPYLLWVHYFDPHGRYDPPREFGAEFPDDDSGRYDGEISAMDASIGTLLDGLADAGLLSRTIVTAIADHGEGFPGPHGEATHGMLLYHDTLAIPWIVRGFGCDLLEGRRVGGVVSQVDVMPTLLELVGVSIRDDLQGRSLATLLTEPDTAIDDRAVYSDTVSPWNSYGWSPLFRLRDSEWSFVLGPRPELYRLTDDPRELDDRAHEHRDLVDDFTQRIRKLQSERHPAAASASTAADSTELRRLAALGYAIHEGAAVPASDALDDLTHPADLIGLQEPLERAREADLAGRTDRAREILREEVLRIDPGNLEALGLLARFLYKGGDTEGAKDVYASLVEKRPRSALYRGQLGSTLSKLAQRARERGDRSTERALQREAREHFEVAVSGSAPPLESLVNFAALCTRTREHDTAESLLRRAVAQAPDSFEANYGLASALVALRRVAEANPFAEVAVETAQTPGHRAAAEALRDRIHRLK